MKYNPILLLVCAALLWVAWPCHGADGSIPLSPEETAWLDKNHTVRVRIGHAPPFMLTDGKVQGIAIDYLTRIFDTHGIQYRYVGENDVTWPQALEYIKRHDIVDMVPTAKITAERQRHMLFTDEYIFSPWVIFTRTDADFIGTVSDLNGKTVSVEEGFVMHRKLQQDYPGIHLRVASAQLDNYAEIPIRDLSTGLSDAYIGNLLSTTYAIQHHGYSNVKVAAPTPFDNHHQAMAVRDDWPELVGIINKTLAAMPPEAHAAIRNRWLAVRFEYGIDKIYVLKWILAVAGVASLFIAVVFTWNRRLKAEVAVRKRAEADLRDRERLLNEVGDIAKIGGWEMDLVSRTAKWTRGTYDIVEIEPGQPIPGPDDHTRHYLPEYRPLIDEAMRALIEEDKPLIFEAQLRTARGNIKWVRAMGRAMRDHGRCVKLSGTFQDISALKLAESAACESEHRLRALIDTIPDLIWLKDPDGVYLYCNPTFERFFGAREAEIVGRTDYDFVDRALADFFREHDRRAIAAGGPCVNEEHLTFADTGYAGLFETIKTPLRDAGGTAAGVLGIARDISERKRAEAALRENEQRYKRAQLMGHVGNWEYDLATARFWGSEEAKRIYGFDPDSKNFSVDDVERCIPERERVHQALDDLIEKNSPYNLEFEIRPVSGPQKKIIRSIAEIVRDDAGSPAKVVGVIQDITKQKDAERAMVDLERQLRQAHKMEAIGTLAGGIAHDFNNILSSVIGFTELALDEVEKNTTIEDSLQEVYAAGRRAKDLVRQILTFARRGEEEVNPIRVAPIAKEVLAFIRSAIPTSIEIEQDIASDAMIMGNATQIHQMIMNLCTNAAHAMEDGGGRLTLSINDVVVDRRSAEGRFGASPGEYVEIRIADNGCGIPPDALDTVFEPYFTTKGVGEGTGLGLAVVHGIVKRCGGTITVSSALGKGTTFTVLLPVTATPADERPHGPQTLPTGNERILLVDDEAAIAKMGSKILERLGYRVEAIGDSVEALERFRSDPFGFDLVITDMAMPHMTGDRLAVEMLKTRPDMPILMCSGYSKSVSPESAAELGIRAFAFKPLVRADLAKTVRRVLDEAGKP